MRHPKPITKQCGAILDDLVFGLTDEDGYRRIDRSEVYTAVFVEKVGRERFSVAHYTEINGDMCGDPDLEFLRRDGQWFPVACTQLSGYTVALRLESNGQVTGWRPRAYAGLRELAHILLKNIKHQQGGRLRERD